MRKYASPRFEKTLEQARNFVNITFPPEFGTPVILKTSSGVAAMFPEHVCMRSLMNEQPVLLRPVGEGHDAAAAIIDLFENYASAGDYDDILVTAQGQNMVFAARETPYATLMFQRQHRPETAVWLQ